MPNYTSNYIIFNRELKEKEINNIKKELFNEKDNLDFNKLIKQPEKMINVGLSRNTVEAYSWYFFKNPDNLSEEDLKETLSDEEKRVDIENKYGKLQPELKKDIQKEEGYEKLENWYNWNCENWGTKWGAYETEFKDNDILFFCTAWSKPSDKLLNKLFNKLEQILSKEDIKEISYEVEYEGEDIREIYNVVGGNIKLIKTEKNYNYDEE